MVYASELAKHYPTSNIKFVSVHPGVVKTDMTANASMSHKLLNDVFFFVQRVSFIEVEQGRLSQLWAAGGAKKDELVNGGYYMPVGRLSNDRLNKTATNEKMGTELWEYTQDALAKV
jgi:NAD(P)-dependent dehydrogenase (short-subunit alcohol dehydrogenase family)